MNRPGSIEAFMKRHYCSAGRFGKLERSSWAQGRGFSFADYILFLVAHWNELVEQFQASSVVFLSITEESGEHV
jgi:hypothetical protein